VPEQQGEEKNNGALDLRQVQTILPDRQLKYYDIILGLFVAVLLISNVASTKIVKLGAFTFDGGTLLFPLSYIFCNILTEVYGYRKARRVIWTGFFSAALLAVTLLIVGALEPAAGWENQDAYDKILGLTPRIVIASLSAYFIGEFLNSFTLAKLKVFTKGRFLWMRTIGSTVVGQAFDTAIFITIAFTGVLSVSLLISVFISNYLFKILFEVFATPVTYKTISFLKKNERVDMYDIKTDFNPFHLKEQ
jgi:queuosine precursor transporter